MFGNPEFGTATVRKMGEKPKGGLVGANHYLPNLIGCQYWAKDFSPLRKTSFIPTINRVGCELGEALGEAGADSGGEGFAIGGHVALPIGAKVGPYGGNGGFIVAVVLDSI